MKKRLIIILVLLGTLAFFSLNSHANLVKVNNALVPTVVKNTFSYKGENGKDALSILKEKTAVEQNGSGLVVVVGGKKADDKQKEYWAFYVNGKMADVGPADYKTTDKDLIEWKIEKY